MFRPEEIPNLTTAKSMKFFGAAIAGRRKVKLKVAQPKLKEIEV
jgi:hypothetical protein